MINNLVVDDDTFNRFLCASKLNASKKEKININSFFKWYTINIDENIFLYFKLD